MSSLLSRLPKTLVEYRTPFLFLVVATIAFQFSFSAWRNILYNFAESGGLDGADIGLQQTIREIPGFLAFTAIFFLLAIRQQTFALISMAVMGLGIAATGFFPTLTGLLITTFIMSTGFHYYQTMNQALQLQWLPKDKAPQKLGVLLAVGSFGQLIVFGLVILLWDNLHWSYEQLFLFFGLGTLALTAFLFLWFPNFEIGPAQHKKLLMRKRYWLYYALTFFGGARRQIFVVFAAWMMVEKFGYDVHEISLLFLINVVFNMLFAPKIGSIIGKIGEKRALTIEYVGLIIIFAGYAFVNVAWMGATLYVIDHFFFALAIAMKTYFQKIADPKDFAPTASVAFTINHIAAVIIPVTFGALWLINPSIVFYVGAAFAVCSLVLARLIPDTPTQGNETIFSTENAKTVE